MLFDVAYKLVLTTFIVNQPPLKFLVWSENVFGKCDNDIVKRIFTDTEAVSSLTTELVLELQSKLVNEVEGLHQEDVVFEGRGRHGPQGCHIGSGHAHSVDLDAFLSGLSRHLRHAVLRTSVCHDHDHIGDLRRGSEVR